MVTLHLKCYRCGNEVSRDITNIALSNDLLTKFEFKYIHTGEKNVLICFSCDRKLRELKKELDFQKRTKVIKFFKKKD
jgi:hypothetical protein